MPRHLCWGGIIFRWSGARPARHARTLYSLRVSLIPHCSPAIYPKGMSKAPLASHVQTRDPKGCAVALLGLADDLGVRLNGGRPGAKDGPRAFREAFSRFGVGEPFGWDWPRVFDAGDIIPAKGEGVEALKKTHDRVTEAVKAMLDLGLFPIGIGGGHDLTYPFVRGVIEWYEATKQAKRAGLRPMNQGFHGIYFDAHLDVRDTPGSGMPFRELIEECGVEALTVLGLNPFANTREHVDWFLDNGGAFGEDDEIGVPTVERPTFVSFDLDVLDASCAPGVSALNPAGWSTGLAEAWLDGLGAESNVRCFDIMEFNPAQDPSGRTARVVVHLFLSFLHGFARRGSTSKARRSKR